MTGNNDVTMTANNVTVNETNKDRSWTEKAGDFIKHPVETVHPTEKAPETKPVHRFQKFQAPDGRWIYVNKVSLDEIIASEKRREELTRELEMLPTAKEVAEAREAKKNLDPAAYRAEEEKRAAEFHQKKLAAQEEADDKLRAEHAAAQRKQ